MRIFTHTDREIASRISDVCFFFRWVGGGGGKGAGRSVLQRSKKVNMRLGRLYRRTEDTPLGLNQKQDLPPNRFVYRKNRQSTANSGTPFGAFDREKRILDTMCINIRAVAEF